MNTQQENLSRFEQAWAKKTSRRIGYSLFGDGSHADRKEDIKQLYNYLCDILIALKNASEFDIDILSMQEAKQRIHDKHAYGKSELNQFIYENYTSYTIPGLLNGGIKLNSNAMQDLKLKQKFQNLVSNIYNEAKSGTNPSILANFREEKYKRLEAIKKRKHSRNSFEYQKWKHGPRAEKDLELIYGEKKYSIPVYSVLEIDDNNTRKVLYPIINGKILELFALDLNKGSQNLHQWLKENIKSLRDHLVIADINADISNAHDMGSYLKGINLSGSIIRSLYIADADCRDMNLQNCDILNMSLNKCLYGGLDIRGADTNKLTIDANHYEDIGLHGFTKQEYDNDSKSYIKLSVFNPEKARDHGIITGSLYDASKDRMSLDPFYVREGETSYFDNSLSLKVSVKDLQEYLVYINQLDIIKSLQDGEIQRIDWRKESVQSFVDFIKAKYGYTDQVVYVDMSNQDLSRLCLNYGNFRNVNFAGCKIREAKYANFYRSCLEGVDADNANFKYSVFVQANMQYISAKSAIFDHVNADNANLERACLSGMKVKYVEGQKSFTARRTNMRFANLENAQIDTANFNLMRAEGITLANAHINYCQMRGVKMAQAVLRGGKFKHNDFTRAMFRSANAELAEFSNTIMDYINAEQANFKQAVMERIKAQGANLSHVDMEKIRISYADFSNSLMHELNARAAKLDRVSFEKVQAIGSRFEQAILKYIKGKDLNLAFATLDEAKIIRSNLSKSCMSYIHARKTIFQECYMKQANLEFAELMGTEFVKTCIAGGNIKGADLSDVNIDNSDLSGMQYNNITSVLSIRNLDKVHVDKEFRELCNQQYRKAFPVRARVLEAKDWCYKKGITCANVFLDLYQLIKDGAFYGITGGMLGFIAGVCIIMLVVPTAGMALTMAICLGGALIGSMLNAYYNSDTTKLSNHVRELIGLETTESNIDMVPDCMSEEKIEDIHKEIEQIHVEVERQQQYTPCKEVLKIREDMHGFTQGYGASIEEIYRESSARAAA